jgi:hypothetical protein
VVANATPAGGLVRSLQPSRRRRAARWVQLILAAGLVGAALAHVEAAAQVPDEDQLSPRLECVARNEDGSLTAKFGWINRSGRTIRLDGGTENSILPTAYQKLVPTEFAPGEVTTKEGGFTVTFDESEELIWTLMGEQVQASAASPSCPPDPRGAPPTTAAARTTTTKAKAAAGAAPSSGPGQGGRRPPGSSLPPVAAAGEAGSPTGSFGLADVVPALVLGLLVLGMVAFGLESVGRRLRS